MTENPKTTVSCIWAAALVALMVLAGCRPEFETGLDRIWRQGRITVLTENNAHCYYIYRDRPVGFEYELAAAFARHLVVDLEVSAPGWEEMFEMLDEGPGDLGRSLGEEMYEALTGELQFTRDRPDPPR